MATEPEPKASPSFAAGYLWPAMVGLLAFLGTLTFGLAVTVLVFRSIPSEDPEPSEVVEGFGAYLRAMVLLYIGAALACPMAVAIGVAVASWVCDRAEKGSLAEGQRE